MDTPEKQDITIGKPPEETPIMASVEENTAEPLKAARTKNESASTETALILALLQTDFSDLQSKGLKVVILARGNKLYASIEYPGHVLGVVDTGKKKKRSITLDDKPVVEHS